MPPFMLGLIVFSLVLITGNILKILQILLIKGVNFYDVINLIYYLYVPLFAFVLPMSVMLSILIAMGRFSADNELVAFQSLGVSPSRFLSPALSLGIAAMIITAYITLFQSPASYSSIRTITYRMISSGLYTTLREGAFTELIEGITIYAERAGKESNQFENIIIYDARGKVNKYFSFAEKGSINSDANGFHIILSLKNGGIQFQSPSYENLRSIIFNHYELKIPVQTGQASNSANKQFKEMGTMELFNYIKTPGIPEKDKTKAIILLNRRFTFPFTAIVFAFISIPVGFLSPKEGKVWGFTFSIILFTLYYILLIGSENLAYRGSVSGIVSAWIPNIIFTITGIVLTKFLSKSGRLRS